MLGRKFDVHDASLGEKLAENEKYVKEHFWKKARKVIKKAPFATDAVALYYCAVDEETPQTAKAIAFGALAYLIGATDGIPDFVPGIGYNDDEEAILAVSREISSYVTDKHIEHAKEAVEDTKAGNYSRETVDEVIIPSEARIFK